jgi:hypothetical protein
MRFLLGVLVGYSLRGKQKLLIRFLGTLALGLDQLKPGCPRSKDLPMKTPKRSFMPLT